MATLGERIVGLIGHPVGHSLSPRIHAAAFAATGLDWRYRLRDVAPEELAPVVSALRAEQWRGFNVTLPHKQTILPYLDELTDEARRAGAVNTVVSDRGWLRGDNTDIEGFGRALLAAGWSPQAGAGRPALVLGNGGAARAAVTWLVGCAVPVVVVGRRPERARQLAEAIAGGDGRSGGDQPPVVALGSATVPGDLAARCRLVVQATSSGRDTPQWLPLDLSALAADALCFDMNYDLTGPTPFCRAAAAAGRATTDGLRMLVEQAAAAFSRWTGLPAPIAAMLAAVRRPGEEP
ncbi:MAG: shikimate dehydrogenase family protein [Chloroflexota bacterium]